MATLVLGAAGAAVGAAALPAGVSVLGATIGGAAIGRAVGTVAGAFIDNALFGASGQAQAVEASRLDDLQVTASTEGAAIPRVYGRARIGTQVIWATNLEEVVEESGGASGPSVLGKGLGSSDSGGGGKVYKYFANFAVGLCEGEISHIGRVWADGDEIDLSQFTYRVYKGTETQTPDSLIEAKEGAGNAPAYRGLAYIVFERMPLADFGNRIPQLNVEVFRPVDDLEKDIHAVCMIPAASEFVYEPNVTVLRDLGAGFWGNTNNNTRQPGTDWAVSLDNLQDTISNVDAVSLFVSWFGDDLRADRCDIRPKVDNDDKDTKPFSWRVQGLDRNDVPVVSSKPDGSVAYGGTPADRTVRDALVDLQDRGLKPVITPFLLMDVPANNGLTDPYTGASDQPVYPWRGRITCDPAPGATGSVDQTATARTQIESFVGTCQVSDFSISNGEVLYSGPAEWSYRRFILHYAHLAKAAETISGTPVEAFVIGTEQPYLTWVRDQNNAFPFVDALVQLAADVKQVLPNTKVTYAADWTEVAAYQTSRFGGPSGEVFFHLDPLWSSPNIDAIGVDNYWPLSDWRDGESHLDYLAGTPSIYDLDYLRGNIAGGEGYDWFYASKADRDAQNRTDITDSTYNKPWVYRYKDIKSWWQNQHYDRPGAVENSTPTAWVPESKPFWMMELGCPAVDKGSNQPNVFYDPKSSESQLPYYSNGTRDDLIQRRHLTAFLSWWDPNDPDFDEANNPQSSQYSGRMVDLNKVFIYTWDARPYPAFPYGGSFDMEGPFDLGLGAYLVEWSDSENWKFGHWITGRASDAPVSQAIRKVLEDYGFTGATIPTVSGDLSGYVIERNMSPRDALQPLETTFFLDTVESGGTIQLRARGQAKSLGAVDQDGVVETSRTAPRVSVTRAQETELPGRARISYFDAEGDYESASVETLKLTGASDRVSSVSLPAAARQSVMYAAAEKLLREQWAARERLSFSLPPSMMAAEPGDVITVGTGARNLPARITRVTQAESLQVEALTYEAGIYEELDAPDASSAPQVGIVYGPPQVAFMDLPLITGNEVPHAGYVAAFSSPFGGVDFYRSPATTGFTLNSRVATPSTVGETQTDLYSGPTSRFDRGNILRVKLFSPDVTLESVTELALFDGANTLAVEGASGNWEVLQFRDVQLVSQGVYDLTYLLRGQYGTEDAMADPVPAGARVVLLDGGQVQVEMSQDEIGLPYYWRYGPSPVALDNFAYTTVQHAFTGRGLKPFSPVHVKGERDGAGNLTISWIRRARVNGDAWEPSVVPLNEPSESYEIDVLDGGNVVRTLTATTSSVVYSAADQAADFGAAQSSVDVVVYQISEIVGRGVGRAATV
ncbi:baseplate multidomain protein megatron [Dichotomicrobium thermohalophilum]|uniref:Putative tail protein n=1 Tax=Dichotomicrobium thermohalophilum TaxID=933063 RepID=A0A397Q706_9HYPH|nr:glycoside hydrolase/phage tail family protein [Dichotomicrobium thermohalophilum]RIA56753.1 putative tail protein [Dichotomicrobium thermohalophilum]